MKVVINSCYGGFSLNYTALDRYNELKGGEEVKYSEDIERTDPILIQVVESMEDPHGAHARLTVVDIPDDVKWFIDEYDGYEIIREEHRTWE